MQLYRYLSSLRKTPERAHAVTIGAYDGIHLGHRAILRELKHQAQSEGLPVLVLSFEPMPREFFAPENPPARLTRFREKFECLDDCGIDALFCPSFASVRNMTPEEFIRKLLIDGLATRQIVVGEDFRFAAERLGDIDDLRRAGRKHGFSVTAVPAVYRQGCRISSTEIRLALGAGDLDTARGMLGRDYSMSGRVVRGLGLGKELGFPTANVSLSRRQTPVDGIFAARVTGLRDGPLDGVASIGTRPTVGGEKPLLEVFIFDFDKMIYGEYITVHFIERLREERTYADLESMVVQMHKDVSAARAALAA
jgi:riboflavin kinase/FMN adenylyltransferase